jgi:hypothetical protein
LLEYAAEEFGNAGTSMPNAFIVDAGLGAVVV